MEAICKLKQVKKDQSIEILGNLTIQFGMYVINEEGDFGDANEAHTRTKFIVEC